MTMIRTASQRWHEAKPVVLALAIGLVLGPLISNSLGWQTTSGAAQAVARTGVVEQAALICDQRARAEVAEPGKLDWNQRGALARKWAVMPGGQGADSDVIGACSRKLAA